MLPLFATRIQVAARCTLLPREARYEWYDSSMSQPRTSKVQSGKNSKWLEPGSPANKDEHVLLDNGDNYLKVSTHKIAMYSIESNKTQ